MQISPFLQFILLIAIILIAAKLAGYLSTMIHQPAVLGELLVGLILGPTVIDILHFPLFSDHLLGEFVKHLAEVGVLLLMFVAGMELHLNELARNSRLSGLVGAFGVAIPILLGYLVGRLFGLVPLQSISWA